MIYASVVQSFFNKQEWIQELNVELNDELTSCEDVIDASTLSEDDVEECEGEKYMIIKRVRVTEQKPTVEVSHIA